MARTKAEIENDINDVECQLSPENLHCDGEISQAAARRKAIPLKKRLNELRAELATAEQQGK